MTTRTWLHQADSTYSRARPKNSLDLNKASHNSPNSLTQLCSLDPRTTAMWTYTYYLLLESNRLETALDPLELNSIDGQ